MKPQHTKGPWLFGQDTTLPRDNGDFAEAFEVTNLEGKNIATVVSSGPLIDDVSESEGAANLNVILAAPEMLAALEHALTMIRSGDLDKAGYVQTVESVVTAAINKAKG